jgi:hypothetical protein
MYRRYSRPHPTPPLADCFGVRDRARVVRDVTSMITGFFKSDRFALDLSTAGLFRPDLSLPAYGGLVPRDGVSPIFNLFDRVGGGRGYRNAVTRRTARDFRGGRLTYDEHDGTDLVCPPGTPLACAAPGVVVAARTDLLRGGLTVCVDHGSGVVTQYTHLSAMIAEIGQPLARGEAVALSGMSGLDMVSGFPWVPPHVHFMVWIAGRPVDPFLAPGEARRAGVWMHGNEPRTAEGPLKDDPPPPRTTQIDVDAGALEALVEQCTSASIREELHRAPSDAARAAICEDSLHHERYAWPEDAPRAPLRPPADASAVRITLPLPAEAYRSARPIDARWTRPSSS